MDKSPDAFRTISEVAEWLGVQAHVLRFWESKFTQVKPVKRAGGRRYYRPSDMELLGGIKMLLHDDGLTIKGVQKIIREQGVGHVSSLSQELCDVAKDAVKSVDIKPVKADTKKASVVPFKRAAADAATPEQTPAPEVVPAADPAPVEIVAEAAPETPEIALPVEPALTPSATPVEPAEEKPVLPSFLHRPTPVAQPTPESDNVAAPTPDSPREPVAAEIAVEKRARVVNAPDPADESDLPYAAGPLAHLAGLDRISAEQVARIAPLAKELSAWLARASH